MENLTQLAKILLNIGLWLLAAIVAVTLYLFLSPTSSENTEHGKQGCFACETLDEKNNA